MEDENNKREKALKEIEENYKLLTESILDGIIIVSFRGRILWTNDAAAKMVGYKTPEEGLGKSVFNFLAPEFRKEVITDFIRVYGGKWGFLTVYKGKALDGREIWVETLGRRITYNGKPAELVMLRDITERKKIEEELKKAKDDLEIKIEERTAELKIALEKLDRLFKATVSALASAVEAKDPYTAGHQREVAKLACAIAREMGLSEDRIDGIYMAAIVHDIGKIHVPAEILTKPGRLAEDERAIINTHPQFGYDILKSIEFSWPVAQIVLQHHERMDGSGYPLGLSGEGIVMEARILAVADVVEAMSNDRPYRASLGVEKALEEISRGKGSLYDKDVVDVCSKLFSKKRFRFERK